MLGFQLFLHSLRMIFGNLGAAIRISLPALIWILLMSLWAASMFGAAFLTGEMGGAPHMDMGRMGQPPMMPDGFWVFFPVAFIGGIVTLLWTATAWHRFILLEEHPGPLGPRFNGGAIGSYLVAGIIMALVIFAAALVMGFVGGMVIATLSMSLGMAPMLVMIVGSLLIYAPIVIVFYRLSPILPSAALGERLSLGQAWNATRGSSGTMLVLAIVTIVASFLISFPVGLLAQSAPILAVALQIVVQWITAMFGISILTTIYGHYVEGRDLNV